MLRPVSLGLLSLFLGASTFVEPSHAQKATPPQVSDEAQAAAPDQYRLVHLSVQAAAAPVPALKYTLLPELRDMQPGNAALLYQRAHSPEWWSSVYRQPEFAKQHELLEMPLKKMPRDKVLILGNPLREVDRAARCESCDWDMTRRIREAGFALLIPDVQGMRDYARMLALRARLEMLDGQYDKAIYTLQTMLAMSRHISDQPILISGLVGVASANIALDQIEELVQLPNTPNLHWALADLPRPFWDLRRPLQGEKLMVDALLPGIRDMLRDPKAPPVTVAAVEKAIDSLTVLGLNEPIPHKLLLAWTAARLHSPAKKHFVAQGRTAEQLEALPVAVLAMMYAIAKYDEHYDESYKWHHAPYWEARAGLRKAQDKLVLARQEHQERVMLAVLLAPALNNVHLARARLDRRIAALQIVEALRLHAAAHEGMLPERLEDIRSALVPLDPLTGKAFEYSVADGKAVLYAPPLPGDVASRHNALRYEVTIAPPKK